MVLLAGYMGRLLLFNKILYNFYVMGVSLLNISMSKYFIRGSHGYNGTGKDNFAKVVGEGL